MAEATAKLEMAPQFATAADAMRALSAQFREAGIETPERDAQLLVLAAAGLSPEEYVLHPQRPLQPYGVERILAYAARRLAREPVSRILGRRAFWGRNFGLDPSTLDPRPETETLVEAVLATIDAEDRRDQALRLLDLGTGTGCILLSLLAELPNAWGLGVDIDPAALRVARGNAQAHGLAARAAFCCGDWAAPLAGAFDVIFSNPPYIGGKDIDHLAPEVRDYDPRRALDGGPDGFDAYRRIARDALRLIAPGGFLALEAGAGQMGQLCDLLGGAGWQVQASSYRVYADLLGHDRVVVVRKQQ
jgi:release factor glutamine methyltransferase